MKCATSVLGLGSAVALGCALFGAGVGRAWAAEQIARPGVPGVQAPMAELKPEATIPVGPKRYPKDFVFLFGKRP